jgi:archaemetzincin
MMQSWLRLGIVLLGVACMAGCGGPEGRGGPGGFESLFEPMGKPREGDWLYVRPEPGQSVRDYTRSAPNRPTAARRRILVSPMGQVAASEPSLFPALREFLEAFFALPVAVAEPAAVPPGAFHEDRKQHDAEAILSVVASNLPADAAAGVGVLEFDLFTKDLNFVFGLGSFENRASVFSIARHRFEYINQPPEATLLRRACKVAAHEIGHIFGLPHCVKWRCILNGSNSIFESDQRPMFLCPDCLEKLAWNLGFDPPARYAGLAAFYDRHPEFKADAARARALAAAWKKEKG